MAINFIRGNILSDNLVRGSNLSFQSSGLSNRDVLFVDVVNANIGINTAVTTHTLTVNGNCNIANTLEAGNLETAGDISAQGNVTGNVGNFEDIVVGNIDIGNIINGGNIQVESITSNTFVSAVGNVIGGNITTTGNVEGTVGVFDDIVVGNIDLGNLISGGNLQVESLTSNTFVSAVGNVIAGNLTTTGIVDASGVTATGNVAGGNLTTSGDISAAGNITAANFSATGNLSLGNLTVANTTISTSLSDGNITLAPTGTAVAIIDTVTGLVLPVGNTVQRPSPVSTGTVRFNTDSVRLEVYDGAGWEDIAANVTNQVINGDGSTQTFLLDRDSTAAATLVAINGVVQLPNTAYTVTGNSISFAQIPESTDVIDIRFL
jgi:hypothetical protein